MCIDEWQSYWAAWVRDNREFTPEEKLLVPLIDTALAEMLKKEDYETSCFCK